MTAMPQQAGQDGHADPAYELGDRGVELLQRFQSEELADDLAAAIEALTIAVRSDPRQSEPIWRYALGVALSYRANPEQPGWEDDAEQAARWLTEALRAVAHDHEVAADVAADLCDLQWSRYLVACADDELAAAGWLLGVLDAMPPVYDGSVGQHLPNLFRGLARLHQHEAGGTLADLLAGIELMQNALPALPQDRDVIVDGWKELAIGCRAAHNAQPARQWLDRAVSAASAATALVSARAQFRPDVHTVEGFFRQLRWEESDCPQRADLIRAIECFERAVREEEMTDSYLLYCLGDLLRERGETDESISDLDKAIAMVSQAIDLLHGAEDPADVDAEIPALYYLCLAEAQAAREVLAPDTSDLAGQAGAWAALARSQVLNTAEETSALCNWLDVAERWLSNTFDPAAESEARAALTTAATAIDHVAQADADLGVRLAFAMLATQIALLETGDDELDIEKTRRVLKYAQGSTVDLGPASRVTEVLLDLLSIVYNDANPGQHVLNLADLEALEDGDLRKPFTLLLAHVALQKGMHGGDLLLMRAGRAVLEGSRHLVSGADAIELDLILACGDMYEHAMVSTSISITETKAAVERAILLSDQLADLGRFNWMSGWVTALAEPLGLRPPRVATASRQPRGGIRRVTGQADEALSLVAKFHRAVTAGDVADARRLADEASDFYEGLTVSSLRPRIRAMVATAMVELAGAGHAAVTADAVKWGELALADLPGPEHVLWSLVTSNLASAIRLAGGDVRRSRALGFDCLRGHAWRALLQSGTEEAISAAYGAAKMARMLAGWCAADGATDELVRALEAGRGLVLHAATTDRLVADQLCALGADELAEEWTGSGGANAVQLTAVLSGASVEVPLELRGRVLRQLQKSDAGRLLDPPDLDQISELLTEQGLSALVYLVPNLAEHPGMAVVVAPGQPIEVVPLPGLSVDEGSPVASYEQACEAVSSAGAVTDPAHLEWRERLAELCEWAWQAAGERLWQLCGSRWPSQTPKLALVPVGQLARVPWHAARRSVGAGYRYLAEDVAISTAPSARLLCEVASRPAAASRSAVIVANPSGDLPFAGVEAQAIHARFYPHSAYLGTVRGPEGCWPAESGAGTAMEVLTHIEQGQAAHTLHLACHASSDQAQPARSRLLLADHEELRIHKLLGHRRSERLLLDRIFLSACSTHLSGLDYDEAFSLSTAFLAAGACTVFGSMWDVSDGDTSALMYMIHYYLSIGSRPIDALHLAQRWMLDQFRTIPAGMPPQLIDRVFGADLTDPAAWAGFLHLGR